MSQVNARGVSRTNAEVDCLGTRGRETKMRLDTVWPAKMRHILCLVVVLKNQRCPSFVLSPWISHLVRKHSNMHSNNVQGSVKVHLKDLRKSRRARLAMRVIPSRIYPAACETGHLADPAMTTSKLEKH